MSPARPLRSASAGLAAAAILASIAHGHAQEGYPSRPVRIVVPTAPGGPSDISARILAAELTRRWGRSAFVDVRPGAGTIIGSEVVAKAPPDGHTLLVSPSTLAINPATYRRMPYDAQRDFAPITQLYHVANLIVTHPALPARNVKELVALARARPGELMYGSSGHGTNPHLVIELFASMAGIRLLHVPYKGTAPGLVDLLAGRVALMATSSIAQLMPHVRSGRLRAIAISTAQRAPSLPDIPTVAEQGVPGYEAVQWSGLLAPAGTPRDIIARLHKETVAILRMPETAERLTADGAEIVGSTPEEFAAFLRAETAKWARVVKAAGIQVE